MKLEQLLDPERLAAGVVVLFFVLGVVFSGAMVVNAMGF